jgi:hypothetical protein
MQTLRQVSPTVPLPREVIRNCRVDLPKVIVDTDDADSLT